jgi:uncharacterized membrane protein YphA (DoxX/SURF4 family)
MPSARDTWAVRVCVVAAVLSAAAAVLDLIGGGPRLAAVTAVGFGLFMAIIAVVIRVRTGPGRGKESTSAR